MKMSEKFLEKLIEFSSILETPEGWKRTERLETSDSICDCPDITIFSDSIMIQFRPEPIEDDCLSIHGTTEYTTPDGKNFTFEQLGIHSSFYLSDPESKHNSGRHFDDVNNLVLEQIERAEEALKIASTYVRVPKLDIYLTPNQLYRYIGTLKAGNSITLSSRGMSTDYILHRTKKAIDRGITVADKEIRDFFKVDSLYLETYDHD